MCTLTQHTDGEQLWCLQVLHNALGDHPHVVFTRDLEGPGRLQDAQRLLARAVQQHDSRLGRHQLLQIRVLCHQHRVEDCEPVQRQCADGPRYHTEPVYCGSVVPAAAGSVRACK